MQQLRWVEYVPQLEKMRNPHDILVRKYEQKSVLENSGSEMAKLSQIWHDPNSGNPCHINTDCVTDVPPPYQHLQQPATVIHTAMLSRHPGRVYVQGRLKKKILCNEEA
jgi:hypothetical protein